MCINLWFKVLNPFPSLSPSDGTEDSQYKSNIKLQKAGFHLIYVTDNKFVKIRNQPS